MTTVEHWGDADVAHAAVGSFATEEQVTTVELALEHKMNLFAVDALAVVVHRMIVEQGFLDAVLSAAVRPFVVAKQMAAAEQSLLRMHHLLLLCCLLTRHM